MCAERTKELILAVIIGHQADEICTNKKKRALFASPQATHERMEQYGFTPNDEVDF